MQLVSPRVALFACVGRNDDDVFIWTLYRFGREVLLDTEADDRAWAFFDTRSLLLWGRRRQHERFSIHLDLINCLEIGKEAI